MDSDVYRTFRFPCFHNEESDVIQIVGINDLCPGGANLALHRYDTMQSRFDNFYQKQMFGS